MGFDSNLFIHQPVNDDLVCDICYSVMEKPTCVCEEGHTFCQACCIAWETRSGSNNNSASCPDCRSTMNTKVFNRPLHNIIMSLHVRCPESIPSMPQREEVNQTVAMERGIEEDNAIVVDSCCGWKGTLLEYLAGHLDKQVSCSLGCGQVVRACHVEMHTHLECPLRSMKLQDFHDVCIPTNGIYPGHEYVVREFCTDIIVQEMQAMSDRFHVNQKGDAFLWLLEKTGVVHARVVIVKTQVTPVMKSMCFHSGCGNAKMIFDQSQEMKRLPGLAGYCWAGGPLRCSVGDPSSSQTRDVTLEDILDWSDDNSFTLQASFRVNNTEYEA